MVMCASLLTQPNSPIKSTGYCGTILYMDSCTRYITSFLVKSHRTFVWPLFVVLYFLILFIHLKLSFVFFRTFFKRSVLKPIERVSVSFWKREGKLYWSNTHICSRSVFSARWKLKFFRLFLSASGIMAGSQLPLTVSKTPHERQAVASAFQQDASWQADSCFCLSADASGQAGSCLCLSARRLMTGRQLPLPVCKTPHDRQEVVLAFQLDSSGQAGSCLCLSATPLMTGRHAVVFACQQHASWQAVSCLSL